MSMSVPNPSPNPAFEARRLTSASGWYVRELPDGMSESLGSTAGGSIFRALPRSRRHSAGLKKRRRRGYRRTAERPSFVLQFRRPGPCQKPRRTDDVERSRRSKPVPAPRRGRVWNARRCPALTNQSAQ